MRRHSEQLQLPRSGGGSGSVRRTAPQWQLPSIIEHLLYPDRHELAGLADAALVEMVAAEARVEVHLEGTGAAIAGGLDVAGGGVDRARRADRDEQVRRQQRAVDPLHLVRHLAEPDD